MVFDTKNRHFVSEHFLIIQYFACISCDLLTFVFSLSIGHWSQGADKLHASISLFVQPLPPFSSCRQSGILNKQIIKQTPKIKYFYMMLMLQSKTSLFLLYLFFGVMVFPWLCACIINCWRVSCCLHFDVNNEGNVKAFIVVFPLHARIRGLTLFHPKYT